MFDKYERKVQRDYFLHSRIHYISLYSYEIMKIHTFFFILQWFFDVFISIVRTDVDHTLAKNFVMLPWIPCDRDDVRGHGANGVFFHGGSTIGAVNVDFRRCA